MGKQLAILAFFLASVLPAQVYQQIGSQQVKTYYVDAITPGSDSNAGTASAPFATVAHVATIAPQGNARVFVKFPDLTWRQLQMPYLNLKLLFIGQQGPNATNVYDVANGDNATLHNGSWSTSPISLTCNGSSTYATFTPVIGNSNFNAYIVAQTTGSSNNDIYTEAQNAGGNTAVWIAPQYQVGGQLLLRDASSKQGYIFGPDISANGSNVPHIFSFGRNGGTIYASVPDVQNAVSTPVVIANNPTITTDNATLCAFSGGGSQSYFTPTKIYAIAVYTSYANAATQAAQYSGIRALMFQIDNLFPWQLNDSDLAAGPVWVRQGPVVGNGSGGVAGYAQEPTVIYEGDPQILTGSATVFKMWYTGSTEGNISYAESADGITWTQYGSNPLISNRRYSSVLKVAGTYYLYASNFAGTEKDLYTSSDGVTWTQAATNILPLGSAGAPDSTGIYNTWVTYDGTIWRMLYDCSPNNGGSYYLCAATSSDGLTWTKVPTNPVNTYNYFGGPSPFFINLDGTYWEWGQTYLAATQIYRTQAKNFYGPYPTYPTTSTFPRGSTADEASQTTDPMLLEVPNGAPNCTNAEGCVYMYYSGSNLSNVFDIKLAIAQKSFRQLVTTAEGATTTSP